MTLNLWLQVGHVAGAIAWLGGGLTLFVLGLRARSSDDPTAVREFGRVLAYVGPRVLVPGVLAVLVFGILMVLTGDTWTFSQAWILIGLGLFAATFLIGVGYLSRLGIRLARVEQEAEGAPEQRALVDRWLAGYGVVLVLLAVAVWDMIVKPGL
jgi:uncharacterized membrane protein